MERPILRALFVSTLSLFVIAVRCQVPQLWGLASSGGANNQGTIFHVDGDGTDFAVAFAFDTLSGYNPEGGMCVANGKLFGYTNLGGANGVGTLFSYEPGGAGFHKILDFDMGTTGGLGWGSIIRATNGKLYGATYGGGGGSGGSLFELDPANDNYSIRHALNQPTDGGGITDRLLQASDGKLYGVAAYGGVNNGGTVFSFDLNTNTFTTLYEFDDLDGRTPYGSLCQSDDGFLYGMTYAGGTDNEGVLFKIDPVSHACTKLLDFTGPNGQTPWGSMVHVSANTLYGTTTSGGSQSAGQVFKYVTTTNTFTEEFAFNTLNGALHFGSIISGSDGKLYGAASFGGVNYLGTMYRFDPANSSCVGIHDLSTLEGISPMGELVEFTTVPAAIDERSSGPAFSVFPNPTSGEVTIVLDRNELHNATLTVTNALGQVVNTMALVAERTQLTIDGAPGLYTLSIASASGKSSRLVVVE